MVRLSSKAVILNSKRNRGMFNAMHNLTGTRPRVNPLMPSVFQSSRITCSGPTAEVVPATECNVCSLTFIISAGPIAEPEKNPERAPNVAF
mmetsp:Transcript_5846/g.7065  ORF Transcript_5846/g.7065 Transcript_5846/m.7065 type:complete len:91 (+) Transcript_5846:411-683(+)